VTERSPRISEPLVSQVGSEDVDENGVDLTLVRYSLSL
jgi:hypothetical protein